MHQRFGGVVAGLFDQPNRKLQPTWNTMRQVGIGEIVDSLVHVPPFMKNYGHADEKDDPSVKKK